MTYLELFQRYLRESGYTGGLPTTVTGATGDRVQALDWINDAYEDIQLHQTDWLFMKDSFSFQTTGGVREYSVSVVGVPNYAQWKVDSSGDMRIYLTSTGSSGEHFLSYIPWESYRQTYLFGSSRSTEGFPSFVSVQPDQALNFYPIPNDIYTVVGEYYKKPVNLSNDTDEPVFPSQYHKAIIWRALMYYGAFYAAMEKYQHGQNEWKKILRRMQFDQLPKIQFGGPLV